MFNKFKWIALYQWAGGIWTEWLNRVDSKWALRNPLPKEIETAVGRPIRILIAPLGADLRSRFTRLILFRSIRQTYGPAVELLSAAEPCVWNAEESLRSFEEQHAKAQKLLAHHQCDVLIVRQRASDGVLFHIESADGKRPLTYPQLVRSNLPVSFGRHSRKIFTARLFVAASNALHVGDDMRIPILRKLIEGYDAASASPKTDDLTLANYALITRVLGESGSVADLESAAQVYQQVLDKRSQESDPLASAALKDELCGVLRLIAEKRQDDQILEQAILAAKQAASDTIRKLSPMRWASFQNSLGQALTTLVPRRTTNELSDAAAAFKAALTEWTRERVPLDWARLQHDLGRVLVRLSDQQKSTDYLQGAIAAFRSALEERHRQSVPLQWAITQHNLGGAHLTLGERTGDTAQLYEAVAAFKAALEERNRHVFPQQWSATQSNLGLALAAIGVRARDKALLQQAIAAYRGVLKVRSRKQASVEWATAQFRLGTAMLHLFDIEPEPASIKGAVEAFEAALLERTRERAPLQFAATQSSLGTARLRLAEFETEGGWLKGAAEAYGAALDAYEQTGAVHAVKAARANLKTVENRLKAAAAC